MATTISWLSSNRGHKPSNFKCSRSKSSSPSLSYDTVSTLGLLLLLLVTISVSKSCEQDCIEGHCDNGSCVCLPGWTGNHCNYCYGRIRLDSGSEGVIHDGTGNYSKDNACSWLLDAGQENQYLHFEMNTFSTECIWDHLYVHDGDSAFAPVLAAFSGILADPKDKVHYDFHLKGRYAYVHFYSDAAFILPGFNISYKFDSCALSCDDKSSCNNGVCECHTDCNAEEACLHNCSNHGSCLQGKCQCESGYKGLYCEVSAGDLAVEAIQQSGISPDGRASAALVYDGTDSLWLLGGYRMGIEDVDGNLYRFFLQNNTWHQIDETGATPWPRYGHTVVFYQDKLFLFGGVSGHKIQADLWRFDVTTSRWRELERSPRDLTGHTAHVVNDTMIVIFGYSSKYTYSNKVLEYKFASGLWTVVECGGAVVWGGYGHTSVFDPTQDMIFVHGGFYSESATQYKLTDRLYQYDPVSHIWYILKGSENVRYMHAAAMMNGLMVTYGGCIHNTTKNNKKCLANDIMAYDTDCNTWHTLPSGALYDNLERIGQNMLAVDNDLYMFGGFNSLVRNDLYKAYSGNCSFYSDEDACEESFPGIKCIWNNGQCEKVDDTERTCVIPDQACSKLTTCDSCLSGPACWWCNNSCVSQSSDSTDCTKEFSVCEDRTAAYCQRFQNCLSCEEDSACEWKTICKEKEETQSNPVSDTVDCTQKVCSDQKSCLNCTEAECMWCSNLNQCIDTNSYIVHFHYGQCMDWTTKSSDCSESECSTYKTCSECQGVPTCGWCDDGSNTGLGTCHDGGMSGPMVKTDDDYGVDASICPSERWHFNTCPDCNCNGHSTCINGTSTCKSCQDLTTGPQCQYCTNGYFGKPEHGGSCQECACNGQSDGCDPSTGVCYCRTRGVIGDHCDMCDDKNKYTGDPTNGGPCYYRLSTDFQYTFNLSKPEDVNFTNINFINTPSSSDRDVDFTLNCTTPAFLNITYKSKSVPTETEYVSGHLCDYFRTKFEYKNHEFGGTENTTFMVYVYDFKTPFLLQISFVQQEVLNLYKLFIIFLSCFLAFILLVAALWKIKHKVESYRRGRRLEVEMQQMARRPFSSIVVEIEKKSGLATVDCKDPMYSVLRRRKKQQGNKPSSVGFEPLKDNKAAILTVIIQLPTGLSEFAPSGSSGVALGSALVSLGSNRKQSLELIKGEKPKVRKNMIFNNPDTCA